MRRQSVGLEFRLWAGLYFKLVNGRLKAELQTKAVSSLRSATALQIRP